MDGMASNNYKWVAFSTIYGGFDLKFGIENFVLKKSEVDFLKWLTFFYFYVAKDLIYSESGTA